jgi:hypothetical protein
LILHEERTPPAAPSLRRFHHWQNRRSFEDFQDNEFDLSREGRHICRFVE